jgi:PAS domain S-box-containing protein
LTLDTSEQALILAPMGRDAPVAAAMLAESGHTSRLCRDVGELLACLQEGAGFALVTEEALRGSDLRALRQWILSQPEWSDFPFILLTVRGGGLERNPAAGRYLEVLGNVTFLERPFHPTTLVSLAQAALRGRRRQYEARGRLLELRESEERYRQIVEGADEFAIVLMDERGIITTWNSGAARITQFTAEEAVGQHGSIFFTPEDRAAGVPEREMERAHAEGRASNERWHERKDGSRFWGSGLMMRLDTRSGFLKIFRDGTAEHESEAEIRELNESLEARVAARTRELIHAQEALRQSQKMEAMGQLTGGVAHDFNNLLTPIVGSLDLLQRRGLGSAREQRLVAGALESAERARTLVQRLLAFARRQPLLAVGVDLQQLVETLEDLVSRTLGPRIKVQFAIEPELPPVRTDPNQLEMAILNLAVNARDAMPDGGTLTLGASVRQVQGDELDLSPGQYVRLSVSDTGTGMDEATVARAVEPFFSTKGIGRGTGLGLSMVHGLAAQLGGAMSISSTPGAGTTVDLWLPIADHADAVADPARDAATQVSTGTALLVDDEELVRLSTADMLGELGYAVIDAASAEEALNLIKEGLNPDILVTDHLMPGMTGDELAREVRIRHPGMPVLLVSGYADVEAVAPDLPRLTKPFRHDELAASLAALRAP